MHIKRAITTPSQGHNDWTEWLKIAKQNNIPNATFYTRVNRARMTPIQASTTPIAERSTLIKALAEKRRKYPKEYEQMAISNGITKFAVGEGKRILSRLKDGGRSKNENSRCLLWE